jgi:large subunit ribosomal protein L9
MKLILTKEVANLGSPGDIVEVKDGYGRNYLVPQGMAIAWTRGAEKQIGQIKRAREVREVRDHGHAEQLRRDLEGLKVTVPAKAGESGQLFGSVSTKDIAQAIKKAGGPDVDRQRIALDHVIKHVGIHQVTVRLHTDVSATVDVTVSAS